MNSRSPHAVMDLPSRRHKGEKIARLAGIMSPGGTVRVLEVGAGSGGISDWFATHPSQRFDVDAVDVVDSRRVSGSYRFTLVEGTALPFDDEFFDVVISNHVIEHVGDPIEQRAHLAEIRRVLKTTGTGYLAVPNRWMLVEPHFRLPFLSWLPASFRSPYVRMARKGQEYDCLPLTKPDADDMLRGSGLDARQHCGDAIRLTYELERPDSWIYRHVIRFVPDWAWRRAESICPTLIYTFKKAA
jgi:SAM-dependent methyltransferase